MTVGGHDPPAEPRPPAQPAGRGNGDAFPMAAPAASTAVSPSGREPPKTSGRTGFAGRRAGLAAGARHYRPCRRIGCDELGVRAVRGPAPTSAAARKPRRRAARRIVGSVVAAFGGQGESRPARVRGCPVRPRPGSDPPFRPGAFPAPRGSRARRRASGPWSASPGTRNPVEGVRQPSVQTRSPSRPVIAVP